MAWSEPLCLFPIHSARTVHEHQRSFSAHTLNAELEEERLPESDEKCVASESQTALLKDLSGIITFKHVNN